MSSFKGLAQDNYDHKTIKILTTSRLFINGEANIKKFSCVFNAHYFSRQKEVMYAKEGNTIRFKNAVLTLRNEGFNCGSSAIDKDFHQLLKTEEYPKISIEVLQIELLDDSKGRVQATITIAGHTKYYTVPIDIVSSPIDRYVGKLQLNIRDFDLEPPKKMFGLIVIKDEVEINFDLLARI